MHTNGPILKFKGIDIPFPFCGLSEKEGAGLTSGRAGSQRNRFCAPLSSAIQGVNPALPARITHKRGWGKSLPLHLKIRP